MQPTPIRIVARASRVAQIQGRQVQASTAAVPGAGPHEADRTGGDRLAWRQG